MWAKCFERALVEVEHVREVRLVQIERESQARTGQQRAVGVAQHEVGNVGVEAHGNANSGKPKPPGSGTPPGATPGTGAAPGAPAGKGSPTTPGITENGITSYWYSCNSSGFSGQSQDPPGLLGVFRSSLRSVAFGSPMFSLLIWL